MKNKIFSLVTKATVAAMMVSMFVPALPAGAAQATSRKVEFIERQARGVASNEVMTFTLQNAVAVGETLVVTWDSSYTTSLVTYQDVDITDDASDLSLAANCSGTEQLSLVGPGDAGGTDDVLTFTVCSDLGGGIASGSVIVIEVGTNATNQVTGTNKVTNPSSAGAKSIALGGTNTTGVMYGIFPDYDQVAITAYIDPTMTFDIDTGTAQGSDNAGAYTVALGSISTSQVKTSDQATINSIFLDLATNGTDGAYVNVTSANAALASTAVPSHTIPSADGTIVAGTANYGICVESVAQTAGATLTADTANFPTGVNCTTTAHQVGGVTVAAQRIVYANGPLAGGRAEVMVKAAISSSTQAHDDYTDTLTFLASSQY